MIEDGKEVGSMKNAINMNDRNTGGGAEIVGCYDPHSIVWIRPVTEDGEPVDEGTLVELLVDHK